MAVRLVLALAVYLPGLSLAQVSSQSATQPADVTQVVIIGTLHSGHLRSQWYTPEVLCQIILTLKPQAILNELPLSQVEPDGRPIAEIRSYEVSPECWVADRAAQQLGIRQIPFDRPDREENYARTRWFARQRRASDLFNKWHRQVDEEGSHTYAGDVADMLSHLFKMQADMNTHGLPEATNSSAFDTSIRLKHGILYTVLPRIMDERPDLKEAAEIYRFLAQEWQERNAVMAQNIVKAAGRYRGNRLVVITGSEHRYILRDLLAKEKTIDVKEYWELVSVDPKTVPLSDEGKAYKIKLQAAATQSAGAPASQAARPNQPTCDHAETPVG